MAQIRPDARRAWWLAIRPATLPAAVAPVLVGSAVAARAGGFAAGPALAALGGALLLQIGANLANDADDFTRGADTAARRGPTRVTQAGLLPLPAVRAAQWVVFALAALLGCYLIAHAGWPIAVLGLASIVAACTYTGGPYPYGYRGFGDAMVFVFFGLVAVAGTTYVQTGTLPPLALVAALPVGALVTAILVVNNTRDADTDRLAGKYTLAVRLGPRAARLEYHLLLAGAYAAPPALWLSGATGATVLLPLLTLPAGLTLARRMARAATGDEFNALLAATGRLHLGYSILFAAGLPG